MESKQTTNKYKKMETSDQSNKKLPWEAPKLILMDVDGTRGSKFSSAIESPGGQVTTGPS